MGATHIIASYYKNRKKTTCLLCWAKEDAEETCETNESWYNQREKDDKRSPNISKSNLTTFKRINQSTVPFALRSSSQKGKKNSCQRTNNKILLKIRKIQKNRQILKTDLFFSYSTKISV